MDNKRKSYLYNIGKSLIDGVIDVSVRDTRVIDGEPHINKIIIMNAPTFADYVGIANGAETRLEEIWDSSGEFNKNLRVLAEGFRTVPIISGNYEGSDNGTYYFDLRNSVSPFFGLKGEVILRNL